MNKIMIHATAQIDILDKLDNLIDETDWNDDNHIVYSYSSECGELLENIEYDDLLEFVTNEIGTILNNDKLLKTNYLHCYFDVNNVQIISIYNDKNEVFF